MKAENPENIKKTAQDLYRALQNVQPGKGQNALNAYLTTVQQFLKPLLQSAGAALSKGAAPAADTPPATIQTLDIDGVSVIDVTVNGVTMAFPVGHVLPQGQPGSISNYTPSEAFGYAMRNAVAYNDKDFFQQLLNGYLYLANQTEEYRNDPQGFGLIGWSPDIGNLPSEGPYSNLPSNFVSSASDADEDIIGAMIEAYNKWGPMTAEDPTDTGAPNTYQSISLKDLITTTINSFIQCDIGSVTINGTTYDPVMTLDNWGHDAMNPDYFDPTEFTEMVVWEEKNDPINGANNVKILQQAAKNTMSYITDIQNSNGGWIPDTPWSLSGPSSFGFDATRTLMRFGEYLLVCNQTGKDPLGIEPQVEASLNTLVSNIFSNNGSYLNWDNGTVTFTPTGLGYGQFTGPLLVALAGLQATGNLPSDVTEDDITQVATCFEQDLSQYNTGSMQDWQSSYFAIELALVSEGILDHLDPSILPPGLQPS
ncbi:MAG: hypothetical protein WDZ28_02310 [Simkaniaceae bacterium]